MSQHPIRMTMIRKIIELKVTQTSNRKIAELLGIARATSDKYISLLNESGVSPTELLLLSDSDLEELFSSTQSQSLASRYQDLLDFFPYASKELSKVGVTKMFLWKEYRDRHSTGYEYCQFNFHFRKWIKKQDVPMHFEHKAGDKLFVDYAGKKLEYVDADTGEVLTAEIFVAILGCSQLTYVEASASQKKEDFVASVERALIFFGGVPQCIVPDNLKSAVTKSDRYEPQINERFADFATHYGTMILPTRSRKPRDKALVEGAVKITYQRIFAPLRDKPHISLTLLNDNIAELLKEHNQKPMQRTGSSRMENFVATEKETLKALPQERYENKHYKWVTVHKNAHIVLSEDKHYYSVPYRCVGEKVKVVYTSSEVEVYYHLNRIAYHKRNYTNHKYTTVADHMPSAHQFVADWNDDKFLSWATNIGISTREAIAHILKSKLHPEQAYKSCIGILSMAKKVGNDRLEKACKRALEYQACNYKSIQNILEKGLDDTTLVEPQQCKLPFHDNIRGKEFYQ